MDTHTAAVYDPSMKASFGRFRLSAQRAAAGKMLLAGCAVAVAVVIGSCDSPDSASDPVEPLDTTGVPAASGTNASGGEAVALSQEDLSAEYATLGRVLAEASNADTWRKFRPQKQAKLYVSGDQLVVNATGNDPALILPPFAAHQRFAIEVVIDSPTETSAQLYYLTPKQRKYTEQQSQVVQLKPGRNVAYFKIEDPNVIDPLRFDPGSAPGTYRVERMTARALPPSPHP